MDWRCAKLVNLGTDCVDGTINGGYKLKDKGTTIAKAKGKLGVLTVGMGAVATTMMAGVEAVRKKMALPVGSLTQMGTIRLGKRTDNRNPKIKDFVPLAELDDLVFGGWDLFKDNAFVAAKKAGVLESAQVEKMKGFLRSVEPMSAAFEQKWVKNLHPNHTKSSSSKMVLAEQVMDDIQRFKKQARADRLVMIWCGFDGDFLPSPPGPRHA